MFINPIPYNSYYNYPVFKARQPLNQKVLKSLKGISCVYCGEEMLTYSQVEDYSNKAAKLNGASLYKFLSSIEHHMKDNEKAVLALLKENIKKNHNMNLQDILKKLQPRHLARLEKHQKSVLKQIEKIAKKFPENDKYLILEKVYKGLNEIKKHDDIKHFKLNEYLSDFYLIKENLSDKENFKKIEEIIHSMPNAHTSIDAFIVKYSRKTSKEIVERLLKPSQSSLEHLKPRSCGGSNEMYNIVLACGKDNSSRGSKLLDTMPGLKINIHNYFRSLRAAMAKKVSESDYIKVEQQIRNNQKTINSLISNPIKFDNSIPG